MALIAYMGWLGHKNIGDEICFEAIRGLLPPDSSIVTWDAHRWTRPQIPKLLILGGGTIFDIRLDRRGKAMWGMLQRKVPLIIWGSGVMPITAPKRPTPSAMHPKSLSILRRAAFVGVRGPISYKNLATKGFSGARVIGDPALLIKARVPALGQQSRKIGLNIGDTHTNLFGTEVEVLAQAMILASRLLAGGWQVELFAMWPADMKFLRPLQARVPGLEIHQFSESGQDLVDWMRGCYCIIGEKLHASVLAAAANVPFISLGYREKNFDFAESVGLGSWVVRTDHPKLAEVVLRKVAMLNKYYGVIVDRCQGLQDKYIKQHQQVAQLVPSLLAGRSP